MTVKKDVNEGSTRSIETFGSLTLVNEISENGSTMFLPVIEEKSKIRFIKPKQSIT